MLNAFSDWLREYIPVISGSWSAVQMITNLALIPMVPVEIQNVLPQSSIQQQADEQVQFLMPDAVEEAVESSHAQDLYELASDGADALSASKEHKEENNSYECEETFSFDEGPKPEEDEEMKSLDEAMECFEEYYYSHGQSQELTQELNAY